MNDLMNNKRERERKERVGLLFVSSTIQQQKDE
jgi:hypothetical protein